MDERKRIVNDCVHALRKKSSPHKRQFELEVKFLRLRVELLKHQGKPSEVEEAAFLQRLKLLVEEFVAGLAAQDTSGEILQGIDTLMTRICVSPAWDTSPS
ncbi:hypothetical protein M1B72_09100 [Geomonas paludis]|uniref:Uncharacterized protein n=1 Tax=Geomonas paludis TaxID=2740185 RepID=A0ABY4LIM0_9BACT|nr:hypothetical protein [Geomonas paludis]UPU37846.1 hypothetical protein M1B72_09100 [Geomonas paludis]